MTKRNRPNNATEAVVGNTMALYINTLASLVNLFAPGALAVAAAASLLTCRQPEPREPVEDVVPRLEHRNEDAMCMQGDWSIRIDPAKKKRSKSRTREVPVDGQLFLVCAEGTLRLWHIDDDGRPTPFLVLERPHAA